MRNGRWRGGVDPQSEELLHGVMHFDARIWRTLPLLAFNPGRLTREWVQGARTRYVSPLALFLFTIFVTFFILSFVRMPEPVISLAGQRAAATIPTTHQRPSSGRRTCSAARSSSPPRTNRGGRWATSSA